jgi:plasmid stabilization system protein ParE
MRVRYTATALAEIEEILSYVAQDDPRVASAMGAQIEKTIARIALRPQSARVVRRDESGDIRVVLVARFKCRIFYVVGIEGVIIRNVRRARQQAPWER